MSAHTFEDRRHAGRELAARLARHARNGDVLVLALPRGGVPVAFEVARRLLAPLDLLIVRKLGVPGQEEYAMGSIASGGVRLLDGPLIDHLGLGEAAVQKVVRQEEEELARRERQYRGDRPPPVLKDRVVILVDDGLATGFTMRAAVQAARRQRPARIVVAVPVGPAHSCDMLRQEADEVVCLAMPEPFHAVGLWYEHFDQTSDREVKTLLAQALPEASGAKETPP